jgi:hypothetical protein
MQLRYSITTTHTRDGEVGPLSRCYWICPITVVCDPKQASSNMLVQTASLSMRTHVILLHIAENTNPYSVRQLPMKHNRRGTIIYPRFSFAYSTGTACATHAHTTTDGAVQTDIAMDIIYICEAATGIALQWCNYIGNSNIRGPRHAQSNPSILYFTF